MKRITVILSVILVLAMTFIVSVKDVAAAAGEWNTGTDVTINLEANPLPAEWLQLVGHGVKVDAAGTICHPFREGAYGWTPVIYQLTSNGWSAFETTNARANEETEYQACAVVPDAGTYALFAYYTKPDVAAACQFDTSGWYMDYWDVSEDPELYPGYEGYYLYAGMDGVPFGTRVTYKLITGYEGLEVAAKGSATTYDYYGIFTSADFMASPVVASVSGSATFQLSAGGCTTTEVVEFDTTIDDPCYPDGC